VEALGGALPIRRTGKKRPRKGWGKGIEPLGGRLIRWKNSSSKKNRVQKEGSAAEEPLKTQTETP